MNHTPKKQKSMDMTSGSITKLLIMFAVPLVIGNLFQQLYNTVDSLVVGNFVGSHALAAVGSTTSIINMIVMFFTGTSVGAGVVISRYYGAHDDEKLHIAVETTMALTFICGILLTGLGIWVTLVLVVLSRSTENYRLTWRDLRIDKGIFKQILMIGLPTGFQQSLTSFSNVYVQSYINTFGSSCMAGWSSYSKIDQFVFLPMQSIGQASTTFMSQNLGAGNLPRAKKGTGVAMRLALIITFASAAVLFLFAPSLVAIFNQEPDVVRYGTMFLRMNVFMLAFCCPNQVVAGAMRGAGDSRTPMLIMLFSFVLFRQIYLYIATSICNTAAVVGFGYPIGWIVASILVELYYMSGKWEKKISM